MDDHRSDHAPVGTPKGAVPVPDAGIIWVPKKHVLRIFIGRFVVNYIETFSALLVGVNLFLPHTVLDAERLVFMVATPAANAFIQAARRAWPAVRRWLIVDSNGNGSSVV